TWAITSIGSTRNPTGPTASNVTRTLKASVQLTGAPQYTFVSLNSSCDNHTLLIKSSGQLTVTNTIYVNSCNSLRDAFDIKGSSGNLSAPDIRVVGGWEKSTGTSVTVNGTSCSLSSSSAPLTAPQPAGCPSVGQTAIADPFAGHIATPALGSPACT